MSSGDSNKWCPQFEALIESEKAVHGRMRSQVPAGGKRRTWAMQLLCCPQPVCRVNLAENKPPCILTLFTGVRG